MVLERPPVVQQGGPGPIPAVRDRDVKGVEPSSPNGVVYSLRTPPRDVVS